MKIYKYFLLHNKKLKPWIKYWFYIKSKDKNYVLSDILDGTSFYLENSSNKNFNLFQINGNSIQDGTPTPTNPIEIESSGDGINLFDKDNAIILNAFVNGNSGLLAAPTNNQKSIAIRVYPNTTYTISGVERSSSNYGIFDDTLVIGTSVATVKGNISNGRLTFTTGNNSKWFVFLLGGGAETYGYNNVQLQKGSTATEFVPYGEGYINITISNRNLLINEAINQTLNGLTFTVNADKSITVNGTATANTNYTLVGQSGVATEVLKLNANENYYNTTSLRLVYRLVNGDYGAINSGAFTSSNDLSIRHIYLSIPSGTTYNNEKILPQLIKGTIALEYEPHQEQLFTIPCQEPMRSIENVRDEFIKQDGLWYEKHNIGVIENYNGETITTDFISTTGSLSTGAFVQYVLNEPNYIECTQEQIQALESIIRAYTYEPITNINSTDITPAFLKIQYYMEV